MTLRLDTRALIWWDGDADRLPRPVFDAIQDPGNAVRVSVVSLWEMQIKVMLGKLALRTSLEQTLDDQEANGISVLGLTTAHILALSSLPAHHRDPFDRMLVAQAIAENAVLVTGDRVLSNYPARTLW
ncbi:MAG: type II toxin-antitoxin system VapC family toxin [Rubricoccaceae bacterium]